jgi:hypothetical protein
MVAGRSMRFPWLRAASAAVVVALSSTAGASPEDIFGFGPRSPGMGGTGIASSYGADAAYTNPALLSRVKRSYLTIGVQGATFDLHADGAGLPGRISVVAMKGIPVGVEVPIPFGGVLKDRIAAGMAFYTPSDVLLRAKILFPERAQFPLLADRSQSLAVRLGLGADIGHGIRVGAGFAVLANLVGTIDIAALPGGGVGAHVDDQIVATYSPTFGAAWDLPFDRAPDGSPRWRVGAVFRGTLDARFSVEVDASKLSTLKLPVFNIAGLAQYDPAEVGLEVAHERGPWVIAAGVTFKRWSDYPGVLEPTILCGDTACSALTPPHIAFSDTLAPRIGVERTFDLPRHAALRARAGALYEPTPLPSTLPSSQAYDAGSQMLVDVPTRFFDATRYVLTLGGGVDMGDIAPFTVDAWAQLHVLASSTVDTSTASNPSSASLSGRVLAFGMLVGVRF